jgi:hypothetical protein
MHQLNLNLTFWYFSSLLSATETECYVVLGSKQGLVMWRAIGPSNTGPLGFHTKFSLSENFLPLGTAKFEPDQLYFPSLPSMEV